MSRWVVVASTVIVAAILIGILKPNPPTPLQKLTLVPDGPEELVFRPNQFCWSYIPEVNINYRRLAHQITLYISSGLSYELSGKDFDHLQPEKTASGCAKAVFGYGGDGFYQSYAGLVQVVTATDQKALLGFFHAENTQHCSESINNVYATIGRAVSYDQGKHWQEPEAIITSFRPREACPKDFLHGAGDPSMVLSNDGQFWLMYFTEWIEGEPQGIRLARAPVSDDGRPGSWLKYFNGSFSEPGLGGHSSVVIQPTPAPWIGLPSVSYNVKIKAYLAVMVSQEGFYASFSPDGMNWQAPTPIWIGIHGAPNGKTLSEYMPWYYYPSVISVDQDSEDRTGDAPNLYLYYAKGYGAAHQATMRRKLKIVLLPASD